jgi:hypothetical protein
MLLLPADLEKDITIVEFALPSFEEISRVLKQMIETNRHSGRIEINLSEEEEERLLRPELIPTDDPKLYEVEYCVMSRSNFGGANTVPEVG